MSSEQIQKETTLLIEGFLKVVEEVNPLWDALPTTYARLVVAHFIEQAMLDEDLTYERLNRDLFSFNHYISNIVGESLEKIKALENPDE